MSLAVLTPPDDPAVDIDAFKSFARVEHADEDDVIEELIGAATEHIEQATSRQFMPATFVLTDRCFPHDAYSRLRLPRSPLISVDSVSYRDRDGVVHTLTDGVDYIVDDAAVPATIEPVVRWPVVGDYADAVTVQFQAGYVIASPLAYPIPNRALVAIKALAAWWYSQREAGAFQPAYEMPQHLNRLINGLKVWRA